jgi:hypothetical protein
MPKPAREVAAALQAKGFRKTENDHSFFTLWVDGKKTVIHTKISHGEKELGNRLLSLMARQLGVTRSQFLLFVNCDLTQDGYVRHLREAGRLPPPPKEDTPKGRKKRSG